MCLKTAQITTVALKVLKKVTAAYFGIGLERYGKKYHITTLDTQSTKYVQRYILGFKQKAINKVLFHWEFIFFNDLHLCVHKNIFISVYTLLFPLPLQMLFPLQV